MIKEIKQKKLKTIQDISTQNPKDNHLTRIPPRTEAPLNFLFFILFKLP
jgi:hypothetical protein